MIWCKIKITIEELAANHVEQQRSLLLGFDFLLIFFLLMVFASSAAAKHFLNEVMK